MTENYQVLQTVNDAIKWMAEEYARNPYAYLNEASVEARLSVELRQRLEPEKLSGEPRETIRIPAFAKQSGASYVISSVQTQYWKGKKIDIAIIDQNGADQKCSGMAKLANDGKRWREDTHIYDVDPIVGIEIKVWQMGFFFASDGSVADFNKLADDLLNRDGLNIPHKIAITFCQRPLGPLSSRFFDVVNNDGRFRRHEDDRAALGDRLVFISPTEEFRDGSMGPAKVTTYVATETLL